MGDGSNDLLAYFVHQVADVLRRRGVEVRLDTLWWSEIDDEAAEQYLGLTRAALKRPVEPDRPGPVLARQYPGPCWWSFAGIRSCQFGRSGALPARTRSNERLRGIGFGWQAPARTRQPRPAAAGGSRAA